MKKSTTFRFTDSQLERATALLEPMGALPYLAGVQLTRASVIRMALDTGLTSLEANVIHQKDWRGFAGANRLLTYQVSEGLSDKAFCEYLGIDLDLLKKLASGTYYPEKELDMHLHELTGVRFGGNP